MSNVLLYLEDDEALASVTKRAFETRGFAVHHFSNINKLTSSLLDIHFTHVLLDLKIGNQSSLDIIGLIKKVPSESKSIRPIVILTGYGTIRTAVQAMKLGAINFLSKPATIDEILAALSHQGNEVLEPNPLPGENFQKPSLKASEWETIQKALDDNQGNISATARQLKMHRRTLQRKLSKRHLDTPSK